MDIRAAWGGCSVSVWPFGLAPRSRLPSLENDHSALPCAAHIGGGVRVRSAINYSTSMHGPMGEVSRCIELKRSYPQVAWSSYQGKWSRISKKFPRFNNLWSTTEATEASIVCSWYVGRRSFSVENQHSLVAEDQCQRSTTNQILELDHLDRGSTHQSLVWKNWTIVRRPTQI